MAAAAKYGWVKRMVVEEGGGTVAKWCQRPWNHRQLSSSTWRSKCRATTTTVDVTGKERRAWRKKVVGIIKDLFRIVSMFETVFLVATLFFFYVSVLFPDPNL